MVKAVVISDDAYALLRAHMLETGEDDEAKTMDELFEQADKAWSVSSMVMTGIWRRFTQKRAKKAPKKDSKVIECR